MTIKQSIKCKLDSMIKGSCVFDKQDVAEVIKDFHIVFCNDAVIDDDDVLNLFYDDATIRYQLKWEQLGPRYTLRELIEL